MNLLSKVGARLSARRKSPKNPMSYETWRSAALVAVLAWAGVGPDENKSRASVVDINPVADATAGAVDQVIVG